MKKKIVIILITISMLMSMTACGSITVEAAETAPTDSLIDAIAENVHETVTSGSLADALVSISAKTPLSQLEAFSSSGWNMGYAGGQPEDVFGNVYDSDEAYSFVIYECFESNWNGSEWYWGSNYAEYLITGEEYTTLSMTIAPYKSMDENGAGKVEILATKIGVYEEQLMYTYELDKKTDPYEMTYDKLGDVDYFKIVVSASHGGVILSDIYLY